MENLTAWVEEALRDLGLDVVRPMASDAAPDLIVRLPTSKGIVKANVDVKMRAAPLGPAEVMKWLAQHPAPSILAMPHVTSEQGRRYRIAGVQYVDSGGNAYIHQPGFHVQVEGRRPQIAGWTSGHTKPPSMNASGLKVVFVLLTRPHLASAPYELLATLADVSKGTVNNTLNDLRRRGYLIGDRGDRRLVDAAKLADDWVNGYARDLRPKLDEVALSGPPPQWWLDAWVSGRDGALGGGPALTHYGAPLRADRTVLYGTPPWKIARQLGRLTREGPPNVILRERFWSAELLGDQTVVPPLLAYADALTSDDPREVEVARELWNERKLELERR
ncbi:type IV toxin-antitoxin system AbiEi family antitoxin [Oryzihumus sp.]|uniref:type IV toxin-antitoxin system AbiEi family antitoxin n=1 Tax=Oryzihumus sp. TaxID=1968903 RepID=UPI002ED965CF